MRPLNRRQLLAYALPWCVTQVISLPLINFVPGYYASDLGVPLATISLVMLASRAIDILTDPLIGMLSDRAKGRFGGRKTWALLGAPVLIAGAWMLFAPPDRVSGLYLFTAISVGFLGFTLVQIPYVAWGAELSDDYDGRSRIVAWREAAGVIGTLLAVSSPLIVGLFGEAGLGPAMRAIALGVVIGLPLALALAVLTVPEPARRPERQQVRFFQDLNAAFANRAFRHFALAMFILFVAIAPGGAMGYLMMKHTFYAEQLYPYLVFGEFIFMLIFIPAWVALAKRVGKHKAVAIACVWVAVFSAPIPLLGYSNPIWPVALAAIRGVGFGAMFILPYSIIADVIDVDRAKTGERRSGLYMAIGGMIVKFALMLGVSLATFWPTLFGFDPANAGEGAVGAFHVAVSYAWITTVLLLIAAPVLWAFPLTRERQRQLQAEIARREGSGARLPDRAGNEGPSVKAAGT